MSFEAVPAVRQLAQAVLPTRFGDAFTIAVFASDDLPGEVAALTHGGLGGSQIPLVRLHSECLTGDVLGSLRCDCGEQLAEALDLIARAPCGVLLYLPQEGRGIGLANKIRAYALQDRGLDTVDANLALGLPVDGREYASAAEILRTLRAERIRLLTNNPLKSAALERHGIEVVERVPLSISPNPVNIRYLRTKAARMGHLLAIER
jgi:GTP cyclohydrolase II